MVLVDPQQMGSDNRINHLLQDRAKKSLSELDKEMQQVLELDISDHDKVSCYNHILQRYLTYYEKSNRPMTVRIDESEPHLKQTYLSRIIPEQVLRLTPVTFRAKAAEILDRVQESNHMSWDERGQLVIDGRPIEQSNMVDLINDVVRNRKTTTPPPGWQEFATPSLPFLKLIQIQEYLPLLTRPPVVGFGDRVTDCLKDEPVRL